MCLPTILLLEHTCGGVFEDFFLLDVEHGMTNHDHSANL